MSDRNLESLFSLVVPHLTFSGKSLPLKFALTANVFRNVRKSLGIENRHQYNRESQCEMKDCGYVHTILLCSTFNFSTVTLEMI